MRAMLMLGSDVDARAKARWLRSVCQAGMDWVYIDWLDGQRLEILKDCGFRVAAGYPTTRQAIERCRPMGRDLCVHDSPRHRNVFTDPLLRELAVAALADCAPGLDGVVVGTDPCNEVSFPATRRPHSPDASGYFLLDADEHDFRPLWREYLVEGYGDIETFNLYHGAGFAGFGAVPFPPSGDDDYLYRSFIDWMIDRALADYIELARRIAPKAETWIAPCVETAVVRPPYPFFHRLDRLRASWPDMVLAIFGGDWFTNPNFDLLSAVGSYVRLSDWREVLGGVNGLKGLTELRSGRRLLSMGMTGIVCGVGEGDDLGLLAAELARLRGLPPAWSLRPGPMQSRNDSQPTTNNPHGARRHPPVAEQTLSPPQRAKSAFGGTNNEP